MRGAVAALVGALVLLATGCGGGSDRLSKEDFQTQANAICAKYQKQVRVLGSPTTLDEVPDFVDKALEILNKEIDEISALNPPEELQSQFDAMLAASDKTKQAADDLSAAAKASDQAAVQKALQEGNAASAQADKFARQLSLDSCNGSG